MSARQAATQVGKAFALKYFFSNRYLYAHVQRRADGHIVAAVSSLEAALRTTLPSRTDLSAAKRLGELLAERAAPIVGDAGVLFEKPTGKPYHGKMKALVDAVRAGGVKA